MKIPGSDGRSYDVSHSGEDDDVYAVTLDGRAVAGFRLAPTKTDVWIENGAPSTVTKQLVTRLAQELVDRGGAVMRML